MDHAVISGDIIASTSLNALGKAHIEKSLNDMFAELSGKFGVYSRIFKGDSIECYVPDVSGVFRVAVAIKCRVKSVPVPPGEINMSLERRFRYFRSHGIRLAIGIGSLDRLEPENGIIDGEAIYYAGRLINDSKTHDREKVTIKNTLFFKSNDSKLDSEMIPLLGLIDFLISGNTEKQCEVLYLKLLGYNEEAIVSRLGKRQSTVNEQSSAAGWNAIEKAVHRFEEVIKSRG